MLPTKMNLDASPLNQPKGTHKRARNIIHDAHAGVTINEPGFNTVSGYPSELTEIGTISLPEDSTLIISLVEEDVDGTNVMYTEFGEFDGSDNYTKILKTKYISIPLGAEIKGFCYVNYKGDRVVIWADGGNSPARILNIDDLPFEINPTTYELLNHLDAGLVSMFLDAKAPTIEKVRVNDSGGFLKSGAYSAAIAYESKDGSRTNVIQVLNPIPISGPNSNVEYDQYCGFEPGKATGKSIYLRLVDLDERYTKVVLYMIKDVESATTAEEVGVFDIDDSGATVIEYTGAENATDVLLDEVLIASPNYLTAQTLTYHQNKVMIGGVSTAEILDAQEAALDIKAVPVPTKYVSLDGVRGSHKDGTKLFMDKFFLPDEVYAFYLSWIMNDGSKLPAVHLPGREAETVDYFEDAIGDPVEVDENATIQSIIDDSNIVNQGFLSEDIKIAEGDDRLKLFHTRHSNGQIYTKMGYWENAEKYPANFPGMLSDGVTPYAGSPVRHHRFPSLDDMMQNKPHIWEGTGTSQDPGSISLAISLDLGANASYPNSKAPNFSVTATDLPSGVTSDIQDDGKVITYLESFQGVQQDFTTEYCGHYFLLKFTERREIELNLDVDYRLSYYAYGQYYDDDSPKNSQIVQIQKVKNNATQDFIQNYRTWYRAADGTGEHAEWATLGADFSGDTKLVMEAGEALRVRILQHVINDPTTYAYNAFQGSLGINIIGEEDDTPDEDGTLFGQGWGIAFSNINVPESLKGKVQGYEIFYAKRDFSNSTIVSQSVLFNPLNGSVNQKAEPGGIVNDAHKFVHHGFDLLANGAMPTILPTHIKIEAEVRGDPGDPTAVDPDFNTGDQRHVRFYQSGTWANKMLNQVRAIKDVKYKPFDPEHRREEWLEATMDSDVASTDNAYWLRANLVSFRANAYKLFETQELVSTGKIFKVVDPEESHFTAELYGGDVTLDVYGLRTSYWADPTTGSPTFSAYAFPTFNALPCGLRYEGLNLGEQFYPKVDTTDYTAVFQYLGLSGGSIDDMAEFTNFVAVDLNLGKLNVYDKAYPLERDDPYITDHPYRIVIGEIVQDETYERDLRRFKPFSYYEIEKGKGHIINLESFGNDLLIHTTDTLLKTVSRSELQTTGEDIVVGSGDLFRMEPTEVVPSQRGYGGLQEISGAYLCKAGYTWIDNDTGKVFLYNGKLNELSNLGMRKFFAENKGWSINKQRLEAGVAGYTPSRFGGGIGYSIVLDEEYNRILFTKRDYRASAAQVEEWTVGDSSPTATNFGSLEPIGFTVSFNLDYMAWSSFHDYLPSFYIERKDTLLSTYGDYCYLHNAEQVPGKFYDGTRYPSWIDLVLNQDPHVTKTIKNIKWQSTKENSIGNLPYKTFDKLAIYNDSQCTGEIDLTYEPNNHGNLVYIEDMWRVNALYDIVIDNSQPFILSDGTFYTPNLDDTLDHDKKSRIRGKYAIIRIINSNTDNFLLSLQNVYNTINKSIR